ncbi:MAG: AbrB/MazE/SpoVT family DNA-binding domain-containing protein [Candidatus Latescibacteria bacterium]|nr:AbrB/MazE/SpoVT family DNA-binding domain-containing protein [Candidatus Latescibacterota bacterium]NIM21980.1 AbrB/MazE/SpoVT family DNA-binding domain-containing protein [Candidatus Latescibacterota bacterium]NIM65998.1 AbrB/MazE/SpoVT family DNA-binding domain-containing protein [Candidatus Latescibacterota bacterium]NIO02406.1 AbrB/MazE/SpoVT family DNA-binding domain-containing protein [Candidatus Latescibacterota bacterium]NIO29316.1 AbrB/MazE/SpoVT family DNA-binding domain-containing
MPNKEPDNASCCEEGSSQKKSSCCRIESVVQTDARGQIVLPKEIREKAGIQAGDKLALIAYESNGEICCISLIKADQLAGKVKDILGPVLKETLED